MRVVRTSLLSLLAACTGDGAAALPFDAQVAENGRWDAGQDSAVVLDAALDAAGHADAPPLDAAAQPSDAARATPMTGEDCPAHTLACGGSCLSVGATQGECTAVYVGERVHAVELVGEELFYSTSGGVFVRHLGSGAVEQIGKDELPGDTELASWNGNLVIGTAPLARYNIASGELVQWPDAQPGYPMVHRMRVIEDHAYFLDGTLGANLWRVDLQYGSPYFVARAIKDWAVRGDILFFSPDAPDRQGIFLQSITGAGVPGGITSDEVHADSIYLHEGSVYFREGAALKRISLQDTRAVEIAMVHAQGPLLVDGADVYFRRVLDVPGVTRVTLGDQPQEVTVYAGAEPTDIAVGGGFAYVSLQRGIVRVTRSN